MHAGQDLLRSLPVSNLHPQVYVFAMAQHVVSSEPKITGPPLAPLQNGQVLLLRHIFPILRPIVSETGYL